MLDQSMPTDDGGKTRMANVVAATEARTPGKNGHPGRHYLRTENPLNPLSLAFYPHKPGFARQNPYQLPNAFDQLASGLPVFDSTTCSAKSA